MKTMATVFPDQKDARRVPKPLMEKRRRDRINHSLETLRLLLLENTRNEKLKNPKVEKAEILESVVNFLRTEQEEEHEHQPMKRVHSREIGGEQGSPCKRKQNYREGMRSCLLRVSHFIATKSQELEETSDTADTMPQTSTVLPSLTHPPPPALQLHGAIAVASTHDYSPLPGQLPMRQPPPLGQVSHPHTGHGPNRSPQTMELSDSVWRPWPQ